MVLGCINGIAWGTKLLLTVPLAFLVCHILKAQYYSLSLNGCFNPPLTPHPPPPPTSPLPVDSICDITGGEKLSQKPAAF